MFDNVEGHLSQDGHIVGRVTDADASVIFSEDDIQDPMETVFNGPMKAGRPQEVPPQQAGC